MKLCKRSLEGTLLFLQPEFSISSAEKAAAARRGFEYFFT